MCFGRPEHILERIINKAKSTPPIKEKLETLIDFSLSVQNICATMESCQMYTHMHNSFLVKELVEKLPNNYKLNWAMNPRNDSVPIVKQFSDWLHKMAEAASTLVSLSPNKNSASVNTHLVAEDEKGEEKQQKANKCYVCASQTHSVPACEVFKNAPVNRKWEYVREKHMCRQCLGVHRRKCSSTKICDIDGCKSKHHPLLHNNRTVVEQQTASNAANVTENAQVNAHSCKDDSMHPYFRIVPIKIHAKDKVIKTFAFLDEGSAVTLIEKNTFDQLGLHGKPTPLCLRWTGNTTRTENSSLLSTIEISSASNGKVHKLKDVHTVESLNLHTQSINAADVIEKHAYLRGLPLPSYENARPTILIGVNNWRLAVPLKIKEGKANEPIAVKCRLGWTLQGCNTQNANEYQLNVHVCDCQQRDQNLHDAVKECSNVENSTTTKLLSADDNRALQILNDTCKKNDDRYEIGLLWRSDDVNLPESYTHALHRLLCLQKKFNKEPDMKLTVQVQIDNLIAKGYARKLTPAEIATPNQKAWYLPIFLVKNPNKPERCDSSGTPPPNPMVIHSTTFY